MSIAYMMAGHRMRAVLAHLQQTVAAKPYASSLLATASPIAPATHRHWSLIFPTKYPSLNVGILLILG